jgi:class 3 adenylate cyclase/predicted ATPase
MFCDLVGSTKLSARLDPEELREVVRAYQAACGEVIERFAGYVAQYLGDGLLVYFGYPAAHEDAAQRAVRTGLGILETVQMLSARFHQEKGVELAVRVGIHTGPVVVGGGGLRHEQLALGETPNLAARLQALAEADTVVISASTHRLLRGLFRCESLGTHTLKGASAGFVVYRVLGESDFQSRLDVASPVGLTLLVAREQEVAVLLERWEQAKDGRGQVVILSGEPGIGKSRLIQVARERVAAEPHIRLEGRCSPYYQNSALYPLIELLPRVLHWSGEDSSEEKLEKLEETLTQCRLALPDVVPLFAPLLSLPLPERYPPLTLSPERLKQKTLEAILALLLARAAQRPMLLIVEDLHWIDPSSLEFLGSLLDQAATATILTLWAARPEFRPPWASQSHLTHLTLGRLTRKQTETMVERVIGSKGLPAEVLTQIVSKTDGVPLFVEELTKMVVESGLLHEREGRYELVDSLPPLAIPATLQDSLMARLDRLSAVKAAKEVAQLGATIGRTFPLELLQAVSPIDEEALREALSRLVDAELLYQRGFPPQTTYAFKHVLIQETAYNSMLKSTRQQHHHRIARVLAQQFPETAETHPELLAHHYTEAGLRQQAIQYWQQAGERALQHSAYAEAIGHFTAALKLLETLPNSPERTQQELAMQMALATSLVATKGLSAPEAEQAYARARELCQLVGDAPHLSPVLWGLCAAHIQQGKLRNARELGEQYLTWAQRMQDSAPVLEAHTILGVCLYFIGELAPARAHLQQGIALYDPDQHRSHAFQYGFDPGVLSRFFMAKTLQLLGYPDQASRRSHEALTMAKELAHPQSLAFALYAAAVVHHSRREWHLIKECAEAEVALSTDRGFPLWLPWGIIFGGRVLAEQGQGEEGIAQMRQGVTAFQAIQSRLLRPYCLALLAEAHGKVGQTEAGLAVLAEALAVVPENGEHYYEAELHRLKGELLLQSTARSPKSQVHEEAEECFRQALDIAHRQEAKALDLRATMSLSRLLQRQGRSEEARQMLWETYTWFTEGFDTADLIEAKTLLKELS